MNSVRNFLITLRSYPLVVALNITGLGFAIAVAYMIAVQVHYEVSYNRGIKDADRVAVIFSKDKGCHLSFARDEWFNMMERKYIEIQENNPAIEQLAVFSYYFNRNTFLIYVKYQKKQVERSKKLFFRRECFLIFKIFRSSSKRLPTMQSC